MQKIENKKWCHYIPSGQNRRESSLYECIFDNMALYFQWLFFWRLFAHWVIPYLTTLCLKKYLFDVLKSKNVKYVKRSLKEFADEGSLYFYVKRSHTQRWKNSFRIPLSWTSLEQISR